MKNLVLLLTLAIAGMAAEPANTTLDQIPHLKALPDSTAALQKRIDANNGNLNLGDKQIYRILTTLVVDLAKHHAISITADRGATIVMDGPGPAFRIKGSHQGTAGPKSFKAAAGMNACRSFPASKFSAFTRKRTA